MLLLLLASCVEDTAEVDDLMRKEQLMVTMHVPGMKNVATRAEGETITKITALTFRNGTLAKQQDVAELTQTNFVIEMPQDGDVIHFFANSNVTLPQNNANISALTSLMVNDANLTYWGTTTYHTGSSLSVTLYRNKAMVAIAPSTTDTEFNAFTQDQLNIVGFATAYSSGMLVPYKNEAFDFCLGDTEDTDYYTLPTDVTPANIEIGSTPSAYVFEHENTAQKPMYAICKIGSGNDYYKVALSDALGNLYPIIRNHKYTIYVADLDDVDPNLRANNYSEALTKDPINLEVKEEVQLGISAATQTLYCNASSIEQVTVTVTVPAGVESLKLTATGFTIESGDALITSEGNGVYNIVDASSQQDVHFTLTLNEDKADEYEYTISVEGTGQIVNVTGASTPITTYLVSNPEGQTIWWQGAMQLDASYDETKLSIPYSYFFDGSGNRLIPIESEIYIDYETLNGGWIAAQTPNNGSDWQNLDGSTDNNNRITVKVTENVYTQINNHHNTVFDRIDAAFIVQGAGRVLKKITLKRAEPTIQTVTFSPTNDQTIYLGGDPLTVTMTVPNGGTLNTLNIAAEGFTIKQNGSDLGTGSYNGTNLTYSDTQITYTFTPTSLGKKEITFTGSGENINEVNTTINVAVKEKIVATPTTSTTLYYDATEEQTVTVDVIVPAGVTTLNIAAADFSPVSADGNYSVSGDATNGYSVSLASDGKKQINFTFTLDKTKFSAERTSTITFSDASDNEFVEFVEDKEVEIYVKKTPVVVSGMSVTTAKPINIYNGETSTTLVLTKPTAVQNVNAVLSVENALRITTNATESIWERSSSDYVFQNVQGKEEMPFTLTLRNNFNTPGDYTLTFSDLNNSSMSVSTTISIVNIPVLGYDYDSNQRLFMDGGDGNPTTLPITIIVPDGSTLTELNISADGFIIKQGNDKLSDNGSYSYTSGTSTTFTFIPQSIGDKIIRFSGTNENLIVDKEISVTVLPKMIPIWSGEEALTESDKFQLSYDLIKDYIGKTIYVDFETYSGSYRKLALRSDNNTLVEYNNLEAGKTMTRDVLMDSNKVVENKNIIIFGNAVTVRRIYYIPSE